MRKYLFLLSMVLAVFTVSLPAEAADYIGQAEAGLKQSPAYVAPAVQGTTVTAAGLKASLTSGDNIVLVMLPKDALGTVNATDTAAVQQVLQQDAASLDRDLGTSHYIIGLSIGDATIGYSTQPNMDAAGDLMNRAGTATTNPFDTLRTYAQYVHGWQSQHPQAKTTVKQQAAAKHHDPVLPFVALPVLVVLAAAAVGLRLLTRNRSSSDSEELRTHFKGPGQVSESLGKIARLGNQVTDPALKSTLSQCCTDIERYFRLYSKDQERDARKFNDYLVGIASVLTKYIAIQSNEQDYLNAADKMARGKESIVDFRQYVMDTIRRGNDADLINYNVDTDILSAQKYR